VVEAPESRHCSRPSFPGPSGAFQTDVTPVGRSDLTTIRELFRQRLRRVSVGSVIWASPSAALDRVSGFIAGRLTQLSDLRTWAPALELLSTAPGWPGHLDILAFRPVAGLLLGSAPQAQLERRERWSEEEI
jgi:hypothetical protein